MVRSLRFALVAAFLATAVSACATPMEDDDNWHRRLPIYHGLPR